MWAGASFAAARGSAPGWAGDLSGPALLLVGVVVLMRAGSGRAAAPVHDIRAHTLPADGALGGVGDCRRSSADGYSSHGRGGTMPGASRCVRPPGDVSPGRGDWEALPRPHE